MTGNARVGFRTLRIVWVALVLSVTLYAAAVLFLITAGGTDFALLPASLARALTLVLVVLMLLAGLVRRGLVERIPAATPEAERLARYERATLLGLVLVEGGGLASATVGLLADTPASVLVGAGCSLLVLLMARPRREELGTGPRSLR